MIVNKFDVEIQVFGSANKGNRSQTLFKPILKLMVLREKLLALTL